MLGPRTPLPADVDPRSGRQYHPPSRGDLAAGCLAAYASGLAAEGLEVADAVLHRSHAVAFMLFNGLPSLPADLLAEATALERAGGLSPERRAALDHRSAQRAAIATYALAALAATEPD